MLHQANAPTLTYIYLSLYCLPHITCRHNKLINELLLMQFYLFNIRPKLHHCKSWNSGVTLPVNRRNVYVIFGAVWETITLFAPAVYSYLCSTPSTSWNVDFYFLCDFEVHRNRPRPSDSWYIQVQFILFHKCFCCHLYRLVSDCLNDVQDPWPPRPRRFGLIQIYYIITCAHTFCVNTDIRLAHDSS